MTDDSLLPFHLPAAQRKKVTAAFDGGLISSDGGLVLLREAERRLGLADTLAGEQAASATGAIRHRSSTRSLPCCASACWRSPGSIGSAGTEVPLFAGFIATMTESDFSMPFIFGYGFFLSSAIPPRQRDGVETSQVPAQCVRTCMGSSTPRDSNDHGPARPSHPSLREHRSLTPSGPARFISSSVSGGPSCFKAPNRREMGRTGRIRTSSLSKMT